MAGCRRDLKFSLLGLLGELLITPLGSCVGGDLNISKLSPGAHSACVEVAGLSQPHSGLLCVRWFCCKWDLNDRFCDKMLLWKRLRGLAEREILAMSLEEVTPLPCPLSGCCTTVASPDSAETSVVRTQQKICINDLKKLRFFAAPGLLCFPSC